MTLHRYDAMIRGVVNVGIFLLAKQHFQINPDDVFRDLDLAGKHADWRSSMAIRRRAVYLAVVGFGIPQAHVAGALSISRQAVFRMMREVEEERDDRKIDLALDDFVALAERGVSWVNRQSATARSASRISSLNSSLASEN